MQVPFLDLKAQYAGLSEEMNAAVAGVIRSACFVGGPVLEQFEADFASFVGAKYCIGVANGTDAIMLAAKAAGLGAGNEVLVPANTFFATAEAITNAGAVPVFVDVDPGTFHMDPSCAAAAITSRTRALIPVHLYGRPVDMRPFEELASRHNLAIIEDCAQAHGASMGGKTVGSSGRLTCYSFYPGKNLGAYGDGGAVTTSDAHLAERLRILRDHGSPQKYEHSVVGYNSRLDGLQAAVLAVKLPHLHAWNAARRKHAGRLAAALEHSPIVPPRISADQEHVFHLFVVRCSRRDELQQFLAGKKIQTGIHYPVPLHLTGAYQALGAPGRGSLPVAETLAAEILSLPMYAELSDEQITYIIAALLEFMEAMPPDNPEPFSANWAVNVSHRS
jgi:dTDP-4-amino-4,6-dideoxygalactose transaminase